MRLLIAALVLLGCLVGLGCARPSKFTDFQASDPVNCTTVVKHGNGWTWYCCGVCEIPRIPTRRSSIEKVQNTTIMMSGGGGTADSSFINMMKRQRSSIVTVLRSAGEDEYNSYIWSLGKPRTVSTFIITSRAGAFDPFVNTWIQVTTALFFSGGDQHDYWDAWDATPLQDNYNYLIKYGSLTQAENPFWFGGTSAGLAIMGEKMYASFNGSVTSPEVLANPFDPMVQLTGDLLTVRLFRGIITDSHFRQRDRLGRLMGFMARIMHDNSLPSWRGISANEVSCIDVDENGHGVLATNDHNKLAAAYFWEMTASSGDIIKPGMPLTLGNPVKVRKIVEGEGFDLNRWAFLPGTAGTTYEVIVTAGKVFANGNGGSLY